MASENPRPELVSPSREEDEALASTTDLQARGLFKAHVVPRDRVEEDEEDEDVKLTARDWFFILVRPQHVQPLAWLLTFALVILAFASCISLL